jgi:hypothetical protein
MQEVIAPNTAALIGLALFLIGLVVALRQARNDQAAGAPRQWRPVLLLVGLAAYAVAIVVWFLWSS